METVAFTVPGESTFDLLFILTETYFLGRSYNGIHHYRNLSAVPGDQSVCD